MVDSKDDTGEIDLGVITFEDGFALLIERLGA